MYASVERVDCDIQTESERNYGYEIHWEETHHEEEDICTQEHGASPHHERAPLACAQDGTQEREENCAEDGS